MTLDEFWDHIKKSTRKDPDAHAERLEARLAKLPPDIIVEFGILWSRMMRESYNRDLWGAAYLINGGCSDDGFEYFRDWLILQGRDVFHAAVANPDTLADVVGGEEVECECYPAMQAWFTATGTKQDDAGYRAWGAAWKAKSPKREPRPKLASRWDFDDDAEVRKRLPRLWALYLGDAGGE